MPTKVKTKPFRWSAAADLAARRVAEDELTNVQIAAEAGVTYQSLHNWKTHPDFAARVAQHVEDYRVAVRSRGIGLLERRVAALDNRWRRLKRVMDERAADPNMEGVPGGETGLMVATIAKKPGRDETAELVKYEIDAVLLRELRDHEKQAAQELGQWAEKKELSGPNGSPLVDLSKLGDRDLDNLAAIYAKLAAATASDTP